VGRWRSNRQKSAQKIAEASSTADPLTSLLVESMKTNTKLAEEHAAQLKQLSSQVAAMSGKRDRENDENHRSVARALERSRPERNPAAD
jgi:hypothetical protein